MTIKFIAVAALGGLAACATPVPQGFDGNTVPNGTRPRVAVAPPPVEVPPPSPVATTPLDNASVTPLPSSNGMPPPPVEVGVVGPITGSDTIDISGAGIGTGEF